MKMIHCRARGATVRGFTSVLLVVRSVFGGNRARSAPSVSRSRAVAVQRGDESRRLDLRRRHARHRRRHQGPDQERARPDEPDAHQGRLEHGPGRGGSRLYQERVRLRRDERGLPDLLAEEPARAHDDRVGLRGARRAGRNVDGRDPERRRAPGDPPGGVDAVAQPVQLWHQERHDAVSLRPGLAQRQGQLGGRRRHDRADQDGARQRPRHSRAGGHDASTTWSPRASTSPTAPSSRK